MNFKRTQDISPPIRLPRQTGLPSPKEIIEMSNESRRSRKRVELPWQPDGRPEPVVLTVRFDEITGKSNWMLYDGVRADACVVWSAADPDPTKVVLAMRDWYTTARMAEGWGKRTLPEMPPPSVPQTGAIGGYTPAQAFAAMTGTPAAAFAAIPYQPGVTPGQPMPVMQVPPGYTPGQPFPTLPAGFVPGQPVPMQPPYPPGYNPLMTTTWQGTAPYPPTSPPHWAHSYPYQQPDLPIDPVAPNAVVSMLLGDLLVAAGVIPTRTLQAALTLQNTSQMERRRIGEILVNAGALPRNVLQAAVRLQEQARNGAIANSKVTEMLRRVHATGCSVEDLFGAQTAANAQPPAGGGETARRMRPSDAQIEMESHVSEDDQKKLKHVMSLLKRIDFSGSAGGERARQLIDLFRQAAIVGQEEADAFKAAPNVADAIKAMLIKETIDPVTFEAGLQCQTLMADERLKPAQAVIAIGYCQRSRVSLKDAISDLNWLIPTDDL